MIDYKRCVQSDVEAVSHSFDVLYCKLYICIYATAAQLIIICRSESLGGTWSGQVLKAQDFFLNKREIEFQYTHEGSKNLFTDFVRIRTFF